MRRRLLGAIALVVVLGGVGGLPMRVSAHALRQSSNPSDGATLSQAPDAVTVTFGEEPDPKLSRIEVLDTSQRMYQQGSAQPVPGDPKTLRVALQPLSNGVYTVSWRTVSAVDGHAAAGAFAFGVGVGADAVAGAQNSIGSSGVSDSPRPSAAAVAARWALYLGLMTLVGAVFVELVVFASAKPVSPRALVGAWLVAAGGVAAVAVAQAADAGIGARQVLDSSIGRALIGRAIPLAVAGVAIAVAAARGGVIRRLALGVAGAGAAAAMLADVTSSHAAAGDHVLVNDALQWVHILAGGVWLGGLAFLLLGIRGEPSEVKRRAVRRFSQGAAVALGAVLATGVTRAAVQVGAWGRLTSTDYGRLVLVKATLIVVLAGLGAVNRWRNVAAAPRTLRGLRRVGSAELAVAAGVILVAATLVNVAPPANVEASPAASAPTSVVVQASDYATTVRLRLEVSPGTAGFNQFTATVTDYDTRQSVDAQSVDLRFRLPARPDLGESSLTLPRTAAGSYTARGGNLSLDGTWQVTALVVRGVMSVEVPLQVTTRTVAPKIDVSRTPGEPTLYTIHLTQNRTVQVYLNPDRPGADIFHATFFDASGNGLPVTSPRIAISAAAGAATPLAVQMLEPDHYVANVVVGAQRYGFDISAVTSGGETLSTHIDLTPGG